MPLGQHVSGSQDLWGGLHRSSQGLTKVSMQARTGLHARALYGNRAHAGISKHDLAKAAVCRVRTRTFPCSATRPLKVIGTKLGCGDPGICRSYRCSRWVISFQHAKLDAVYAAMKVVAGQRLQSIAIGIDNDASHVHGSFMRPAIPRYSKEFFGGYFDSGLGVGVLHMGRPSVTPQLRPSAAAPPRGVLRRHLLRSTNLSHSLASSQVGTLDVNSDTHIGA